MENPNGNVPETRSRSRSKTPLTLRVSVDRDLEEKKTQASKNPSVVTITEEAEPTASPIVRSTRGAARKTRVVTSDYSSEDVSPESSRVAPELVSQVSEQQQQQNNNAKTTTITTTVVSSSTSSSTVIINNNNKSKSSNSSEAISKVSTTSGNKSKEINQNEINKILEDTQATIHTSTPNSTSKLSRKFTSRQYNVNEQEHIPYKEYKDAGEYWNKYPKTDYTYSVMSPCRREIVPGVIAMPNMSRRSLEKHDNRVKGMVHDNPQYEQYIRARYQKNLFASAKRDLVYDSADEADLSQFDRKTTVVTNNGIVKRFFLAIVTFFYSSVHSVSRIFNKSDHDLYYTREQNIQRGFFHKIGSALKSLFVGIFRRIYIFIATFLYWDSWLLQSKSNGNSSRKRLLLSLLILLTLLGFGAWGLANEEQKKHILSIFPAAAPLIAALPNINLQLFPESSQSQSTSQYISDNIKNKLDDNEYRKLILHIENYIERVLVEKTAAAVATKDDKSGTPRLPITPEMEQFIVKIIKENLSGFKYQMTEEDLANVAAKIRLQLDDYFKTEWFTTINSYEIKLGSANIEEIKKLIQSEMHLHRTEFTVNTQEINLDDILSKILGSAALIDLIDERISLKSTNAELDKFKIDFEAFKKNLALSIDTQRAEIDGSLGVLASDHKRLAEEFVRLQAERQADWERILNEVDAKLLSSEEKQLLLMDDRIRSILMEIFDYKGTGSANVDIRNWIKSVFIAKEELENKLNALTQNSDNHVVEEVKNSANILMMDISKRIKEEVLLAAASAATESKKQATVDGNIKIDTSIQMTTEDVKRLVKEALAVYDADKTGLVDYALETAGGQILSTRCTESYQAKSAQISIFGIPLWYPTNTPRVAITPSVQPGQCWAFQGFPGFLVIQLNSEVYISGFTIEHIPQLLSPNGNIDSAPKEFSVWGLVSETDQEPVQFGKYVYKQNTTSLQYFPVQNMEIMDRYKIVELRIESNHGNPSYTCLYRFRVHGKLNN